MIYIPFSEGVAESQEAAWCARLGYEHSAEAAKTQQEGLTQKEFNDRMNDLNKYQIVNPISNRSYKF